MVPRQVSAVVLVLLVVLAGCAGVGPAAPNGTSSPTGDVSTETDAGSTGTQSDTPTAFPGTNGTLSVHYVDVGQSDSTLVVGPAGETMLIDTGDFTDDGEHVLAYLERLGVERIDYLITSHADADHIGGHAAVIEHYETEEDGIGAIYDPGIAASTRTYEEYLDAVERHNVTLYRTMTGDSIPMAGATVDVLAPPEEYLADRDRNENSVVLHASYGRASFLFTGDAGPIGEGRLVDEYGDALGSSVLGGGHHGSSSSMGEELLDAVRPRAVVISSAYDSEYGHPHEETLRRLADRSILTYWTGVHGDVVLATDGRSLVVSTQRDATTEPLSLREASPIEPEASDGVEPRLRIDLDDGRVTTPTASETTTPAAETATAAATDGGTTANGTLAVAEIHEDAAGPDGENLNDEYVVFENRGNESVDLSGWTVEDEADHEYTFPDGFTLAPDASVTLHTGSGIDNETHLYWGASAPVWNNGGDTVAVRDGGGVVLTREYE